MSSGGEDANDLDVFTSAFQVSFPILPNTETAYNNYNQPGGTSPYPLDYVIDQAGNVAYSSTEYDPEAMVAVIEALLAQPAAAGDAPQFLLPQVFAYPNPFNPRTEISFTIVQAGRVSLTIYDARGNRVRQLLTNETYGAGTNSVRWDGVDDTGRAAPTGLYLVRVKTDRRSVTGKLTLIR